MSLKDEYAAFINTCGIADLSWRGKIKVSGRDRIDFLHNILTQDIAKLKPGMGSYAALLSSPGKILADMHVSIFEDHILLDLEAGLEEKLAGLLERYIITEDVLLASASKSFAHLFLKGPEARRILGTAFREVPLPDPPPFFHEPIENPWGEVILKKSFQKDAWHLLIAGNAAEPVTLELLKAGKTKGLAPAGLEAWEILRIEAGIPRYGRDMDENTLLSETGLENLAASETKGCYPGQEVVARIKTYKGLKRKLATLTFEGGETFKSGENIYTLNGDVAGEITSCAVRPGEAETLALGYLAISVYSEENSGIFLKTGGGTLRGEIRGVDASTI